MRFSTSILAGAFVAVAVAQSSSQTTADTPTSTYSLTPEQSSVAACYSACNQSDVGCLAKCNPVPNPSDDQVNKTNECVAKCDQGKGTESDIAAYTTCQNKCIADYYYDDKNGTPQSGSSGATTTASSGSSQTSGSSASGTQSGSQASASGSATATASGSKSSETGAASSLFGSSVALLGAVAAALAL